MISNKAKGMSSFKHIQKSQDTGESGERRFYDSCRAAEKDIKKTKKGDDMHRHTDFLVDGVSFDVKGLKQSQSEGRVILEVLNVQGKMGWCNHKKKPEWIAFDFGGFFLCARNEDLYDITQDFCQLKDTVPNIKDSLYKGYTRKNRKDLMTTVLLHDVLDDCEHWFLPYKQYRAPMQLL